MITVQDATAHFRNGKLELEWNCPFCSDFNSWEWEGLPPLLLIPPIPCFCHGCHKPYMIRVQQKWTVVQ